MKWPVGIDEKASKAHIAIVDDDALVREALSDCMETGGYSVEASLRPRNFWSRLLARTLLVWS